MGYAAVRNPMHSDTPEFGDDELTKAYSSLLVLRHHGYKVVEYLVVVAVRVARAPAAQLSLAVVARATGLPRSYISALFMTAFCGHTACFRHSWASRRDSLELVAVRRARERGRG